MQLNQSILDVFDKQAKIRWPTESERETARAAWTKYCFRNYEPTLEDSLAGTWTLWDPEAFSLFEPLAGEAKGYVLLFNGFGIRRDSPFFPYELKDFLRVAPGFGTERDLRIPYPDIVFIAFRDDFVFAENVYDERAVQHTLGVTWRAEPFFGTGSIDRLYAAHPRYVRERGYHRYGYEPRCFSADECSE